MNIPKFVDLTEADFAGFSGNNCIVRLYHNFTGWYLGVFSYAKIGGNVCSLRLDPFLRIERFGPFDPFEVDPLLIRGTDFILSSAPENGLPFQIADPQKAVPPIHESIMIIDSENKTGNNEIEKKVVILSKRPADVECFNLLVKSLRPLKPA